jgi:integrase
MSTTKQLFGNRIVRDLRDSSLLPLIYPPTPSTVQELLATLHGSKYFSMLQTTALHLSNFLNIPVDQLSLDAIHGVGPSFRLYLKERRFKTNAVRSYSNFVGMLLRLAKDLGWTPHRSDVCEAWQPIASLVPRRSHCGTIIGYAIQHQKKPSSFADQDLLLWGEEWLKQGRTYVYVRGVKSEFRKFIRTHNLSALLPSFSCLSVRPSTYGVPVRFFPRRLKNEVERLLKWKVDVYAEGRPRKARLRRVSADDLEESIGRIYGFLTNIKGRKNISKLLDVINTESIRAYIDWCVDVRGRKKNPLIAELGLICAALRWCPSYKNHDFSWFRTLISQIEPDNESEKQERKARKYVPYEKLQEIPGMIRVEREQTAKSSPKQLALLVRDELIFSWLIKLVWRQRNIRECRIGHNLFKAAITPFDSIAIPIWTRERMKHNPSEECWQFRFGKDETKTKHEVRAILPLKLVPLLEEYLQHYRPTLLSGADPGTLFLNSDGGSLTLRQTADLLSELALRYVHKRVTPHGVRDIFAYHWLEHHPEDYLTLSKLLWHRDIKTTLRIYGCRFDESHGLRRVEEWLDSRAENHQHISSSTPEKSSVLNGSDRYGPSKGNVSTNPDNTLPMDLGRGNVA